MSKAANYLRKRFGLNTYRFYGDYTFRMEARQVAAGIRLRGSCARVTEEPDEAKRRANKTGKYLVWIR